MIGIINVLCKACTVEEKSEGWLALNQDNEIVLYKSNKNKVLNNFVSVHWFKINVFFFVDYMSQIHLKVQRFPDLIPGLDILEEHRNKYETM